jgi:hypothetical protein
MAQVTALARAMFQTLKRRFLSLAPGILSQIALCDIYGKQKDFGSKLFKFICYFLDTIIIPPLLLTQLSIPSAICNKPNKAAHYHFFGSEI